MSPPLNVPDTSPSAYGPAGSGAGPPVRFSESAKGWHGIQLAVLGFIGICGLLWGTVDSAAPLAIRVLAGVTALAAFVVALLAIYLVGTVAHPLRPSVTDGPATGGGRLRVGVWLTYLAVAMVVAATLTAWWPGAEDADLLEATDLAGQTRCGTLTDSAEGAVRLETAEGPITIRLRDLASIEPVSACE